MELENLGPIRKGEIETKPLTVLVGPNNSGKSYLATLVYSIEKSMERFLDSLLAFGRVGIPLDEELIARSIAQELSGEIRRLYSCEIRDLITPGEKEIRIRVNFPSGDYIVFRGDEEMDAEDSELSSLMNFISEFIENKTGKETKRGKERFTEILSEDFWVKKSFYLPAARSGILHAQRALISAIVEQSPLLGLRDVRVPKFPGTVVDFLSEIILLGERRGDDVLRNIAVEYERKLIEGEIRVNVLDQEVYPRRYQINYLQRLPREMAIPLVRTSSSIMELTPILLYLRRIVSRGSLLIIEEPEAHIHPRVQRILASLITRIVSEDVSVILTTHSDYFLSSLNNLIISSGLSEEDLEEMGIDPREVVEPSKVSSYIFERLEDGSYSVKEMKVDEDGIPEEEFTRVHEALYEEEMEILDKLEER